MSRKAAQPKQIELVLPILHEGQQRIVDEASRFNVLACGRRFGKTMLGVDLLVDKAIDGGMVGWFSPTYRMLNEVWKAIHETTRPLHSRVSLQEHRIELITGGAEAECPVLEELDAILRHGSHWAVERGFGTTRDLERTEDHGKLAEATPEQVSDLLGDIDVVRRVWPSLYSRVRVGDPGGEHGVGRVIHVQTRSNTERCRASKRTSDPSASAGGISPSTTARSIRLSSGSSCLVPACAGGRRSGAPPPSSSRTSSTSAATPGRPSAGRSAPSR